MRYHYRGLFQDQVLGGPYQQIHYPRCTTPRWPSAPYWRRGTTSRTSRGRHPVIPFQPHCKFEAVVYENIIRRCLCLGERHPRVESALGSILPSDMMVDRISEYPNQGKVAKNSEVVGMLCPLTTVRTYPVSSWKNSSQARISN